MDYIFFIHSTTEEHLGFFYIFATVNNGAMLGMGIFDLKFILSDIISIVTPAPFWVLFIQNIFPYFKFQSICLQI